MADETKSSETRAFDNKSGELLVPGEPASVNHQQIGRYRVQKVLGKGGFGVVYLARDEQLDRFVAVKVPHAELISKPDDIDSYLAEARVVASLEHPHIVPVYDVGSTPDWPFYVVSRFIPGTDLASLHKTASLKYLDAVGLVATIAEALHYAHKRGLVHRDVKPSNILINNDKKPYVVDFGLALREQNVGQGPKFVGTPAYMSPEQARGEGHRVDGRSDVFSLGVVFYELLVGRKPFRGTTQEELWEQVTSYEPRPLRQYNEKLPKELERICCKALAKRANDRYSSAYDLADDLRLFLAEQPLVRGNPVPNVSTATSGAGESPLPASTLEPFSETPTRTSEPLSSVITSLRVVPKGLRSFDAQDADFFLELLPGPRDREGLPESLRFWRGRILETDPDNAFTVGLIYGPSGCGKSSLVKAGLLAGLPDKILSVYFEATPDDTEARLLHGLRKRCPDLRDDLSLKESLAALRRGQGQPHGKKILIVLDQFEQWLHASTKDNAELVGALRQCDGSRVQCIVMVRDDFWLAVSRFLKDLEVRLVEGHNILLVDLFDTDHAIRVLSAFGRAFGRLAPDPAKITKEQKDFLQNSVAGLAEQGKVTCVRLALFAEMMKSKPWTPATLKDMGGAKGVGATFLEETFCSAAASPEHRYHQMAARGVLRALLPQSVSNIRGEMKSYDELLQASGYARRPHEFVDLLRILDGEIRLITPTDPAGASAEPGAFSNADKDQKFYQLTHDYLVPSLRSWLTRKQKESRRGRAELLLEDRAAVWNARSENRQLPSLSQWLQISWFTSKKNWTGPQQIMMARAGRYLILRGALLGLILITVAITGVSIRDRVNDRVGARYAEALVESLLNAEITQVPAVVSNLTDYRRWTDPLLRSKYLESGTDSTMQLHIALALLPTDNRYVDELSDRIVNCTWEQFPILRHALAPYGDLVSQKLQPVFQDESKSGAERIQAAAALAAYSPSDAYWSSAGPFLAENLTARVSSLHLGIWRGYFQPVQQHLVAPLMQIQGHRRKDHHQREAAAFLLAEYLRAEPVALVEALLSADTFAESEPLIASLKPQAAAVRQKLQQELQRSVSDALLIANDQLSIADRELRDNHWNRQALAAVTLVELGYGEDVWPLLVSSANPSLRNAIVNQLGTFRGDYASIAARLSIEPDSSVRAALLQALGSWPTAQIPPADRHQISLQLRSAYAYDADPGVHSSAGWALKKWQETLPTLPLGEPDLSDVQSLEMKSLANQIRTVNQKLVEAEQDLPARRAAWESQMLSAPADAPSALSSNLLNHLGFDESGGKSASNDVDHLSDGIYIGPGEPTWVPGVKGNAFYFDGEGGHFSCADAIRPERNAPITFVCWFLAKGDQRGALFGKFNDADERGFAINIDGAKNEILCEWSHHYPEDMLIVRGATENLVGHWHHLLVSYDGSSVASGVNIFLDGQLLPPKVEADRLSKNIGTSTPLRIGRRDTLFLFRGALDEVEFYNRPLGQADAKQFYLSGLRSLASIPLQMRTAEQTDCLAASHRAQDILVQELKSQLADLDASLREVRWETRRWFLNHQGQTMVVFTNPAGVANFSHPYGFAVCSHEVTLAEFQRFRTQHVVDSTDTPTEDCPVNQVSWFMAAEYCNWLSKQEGVTEDQWVYVPNAQGKYASGMTIKPDYTARTGYRLLDELEWEYACRLGTTTSYSFGEQLPLLDHYASYMLNSSGHCQPVESRLPNAAGIFDIHGNVWEWTMSPASGPMSPVDNNRMLRGGSFSNLARDVRTSLRSNYEPSFRVNFNGFRIARSLPTPGL